MRRAGARSFGTTAKFLANLGSNSRGLTSLVSHPPRSGFVQLVLLRIRIVQPQPTRIFNGNPARRHAYPTDNAE